MVFGSSLIALSSRPRAEIRFPFRFLATRTRSFSNWDALVDKPQFATAPKNNPASAQIAHPSAVSVAASVGNYPINEEQINDPRSSPILDQESLGALRKFVELLDEWDRKEEQP